MDLSKTSVSKAPLVPVHLIAGPLGVGKTTTVLEWIQLAPRSERWAVLVNEYGEVAIDSALLSGSGNGHHGKLYVREIAGGCICCGRGDDLAASMRAVLESIAPNRILIEPTGLANAPALKAELLTSGKDWGIELISTLCLLDVRRFQNPRLLEMPYWLGLIQAADVILGSKADRCTDDKIAAFRALLESVVTDGNAIFTARDKLFESGLLGKCTENPAPVSALGSTLERAHAFSFSPDAKGWIFSADKCFPFQQLLDVLNAQRMGTERMKGIFRTDRGVYAMQSVNAEPIETRALDSASDSRLEVILALGRGADRAAARLHEIETATRNIMGSA